jgi:hypothetical protein
MRHFAYRSDIMLVITLTLGILFVASLTAAIFILSEN